MPVASRFFILFRLGEGDALLTVFLDAVVVAVVDAFNFPLNVLGEATGSEAASGFFFGMDFFFLTRSSNAVSDCDLTIPESAAPAAAVCLPLTLASAAAAMREILVTLALDFLAEPLVSRAPTEEALFICLGGCFFFTPGLLRTGERAETGGGEEEGGGGGSATGTGEATTPPTFCFGVTTAFAAFVAEGTGLVTATASSCFFGISCVFRVVDFGDFPF